MGYFQIFLILKNPIKIKLRFLIKIKLRFSEGWMHPESTSILKNPIKIKLRFSEGRMRPESTSILKNPIKIKLNLDLLLREIIKRTGKTNTQSYTNRKEKCINNIFTFSYFNFRIKG